MYTRFDNKLFSDWYSRPADHRPVDELFYFDRDGADLTLRIHAYEMLYTLRPWLSKALRIPPRPSPEPSPPTSPKRRRQLDTVLYLGVSFQCRSRDPERSSSQGFYRIHICRRWYLAVVTNYNEYPAGYSIGPAG